MRYQDFNDYELISQVSENEEVIDVLFEKYRPLIVSIAKKLYLDNQNSGLEINDLIQEGMIGFSVALNTYNEHKDALFFTYAKKCIETRMISTVVSANRLKHKLLNNSVSMEAIDSDDFSNSLDRIIGDASSDPEAIIVDSENVNLLIQNISKELTDFESQVFDLKKSGFNYKEIAEVLDVDPKKIDNALQRIKTKIRNYLNNKDDI